MLPGLTFSIWLPGSTTFSRSTCRSGAIAAHRRGPGRGLLVLILLLLVFLVFCRLAGGQLRLAGRRLSAAACVRCRPGIRLLCGRRCISAHRRCAGSRLAAGVVCAPLPPGASRAGFAPRARWPGWVCRRSRSTAPKLRWPGPAPTPPEPPFSTPSIHCPHDLTSAAVGAPLPRFALSLRRKYPPL